MEKINVIVLFVVFAFLLSYFEPGLILMETTVAGGDTASHHAYAEYMKDYLLPHGKFSGWYPGAYAGFPVFVFYFFPPFMLAALMGYIIPLEVALKIVTVLGIFSLPVTTFLSMRFMRFRSPMPVIAAVFTLPFLFMEANTMWGGNIPSTLAGEFSYSISLSLAVLFVGLLYRRLEDNRGYLAPALLLLFVTFTHVYTTLFVVLSSVFFLLTRNRERFTSNFTFLFWVYLVPFLLAGFWTLPLVANMGYTTSYVIIWDLKGIEEVFPPILHPFYFFAIFGLYSSWRHREKRIFFIVYSILTAFVLYLIAPKLGIVDIRFLPFIQLFILFISAYGFAEVTKGLKGQNLLPLIAIVATIMWVNSNVTYIHNWTEWNYEGFENKPLWSAYSGVNEFLKGDVSDPRVMFEHSALHNPAGSTRAFESLPHFSGRSTLEGLYMQSSITAPFVFLFQAEMSDPGPCPFPAWPCGRFNTTRAARHMEMFNIGEVIAISGNVKSALKKDENYRLAASFPPYEVYELLINRDQYVVVPDYEPVLFETEHWQEDSYLWFLRLGEVPLVFKGPDKENFRLRTSDLEDVPRVPLEDNCSVNSTVKNEEILIQTDCVGKPHIIRVSYFPNWKVDSTGASEVYLVYPSFMLVYPKEENVRLYYGKTFIDYLGLVLTVMGLYLLISGNRIRKRVFSLIEANQKLLFASAIFLGAFTLFVVLFSLHDTGGRDVFYLNVSTSLGRYDICDRIESQEIGEECYKEVGIDTNDYNLCDWKIKTNETRDECFKEVGINTDDYNLCDWKISDRRMKDECFKEVAVNTDDANLCGWKISDETLKKECYATIAAREPISP